jgi:hypothetical protein
MSVELDAVHVQRARAGNANVCKNADPKRDVNCVDKPWRLRSDQDG